MQQFGVILKLESAQCHIEHDFAKDFLNPLGLHGLGSE